MFSLKDKHWDITPLRELLDPESGQIDSPSFESSLNAHGMYETMRFVLRLSPRNHELLSGLTSGTYSSDSMSSEALQAYSTYIHETVHWWQHVGSTSGLLFSLSYLGQTHGSIAHLKKVVATFPPKKSLKNWAEEILKREGPNAQKKLVHANVAVNNFIDIEHYKAYAFNPKKNSIWLPKEQYFESVGHGYNIAYGQLLSLLSYSIDTDYEILPNPKKWEEHFRRLNENRHEGCYWSGTIRKPPTVGLHAIYEGQARFIQLQFLSSAKQNVPSCKDWREMGYLSGIYVEAFEQFLILSNSSWPEEILDPIVGLFLIICDISINPTRGLPLEIKNFSNFVKDVDVGARFMRLCIAIKSHPRLRNAILLYSKEEYIEIATQLAKETGYDNSINALREIESWKLKLPALATLMEEHRTFQYDLTNQPVRVFLSHFVSFSCDKLENPQFFCWPGVWMQGDRATDQIKAIWLRHLSLFSDQPDQAGVFPRKQPGRDDVDVQRTFEDFYNTISLYDITRQWVLYDGPFSYNYEWLSASSSEENSYAWANRNFMQTYGISLSDFSI